MNHAELVKEVMKGKPYRTRSGEVEHIVLRTLGVISGALIDGAQVNLQGIGTLKVKDVLLDGHKSVIFVADRDLTNAVNN